MGKRIFLFLNLFTLSFFPLSVSSADCLYVFLSCFRLKQKCNEIPLVQRTSCNEKYQRNDEEDLIKGGRSYGSIDIDPQLEEDPKVSTERGEKPLIEDLFKRTAVVYRPTFLEENDYISKNPTKKAWVVNHGMLVNLIDDEKISPNRYIEISCLDSRQKLYKHILCCIEGKGEEPDYGSAYHTLPISIQYLVQMGALLNNPATVTLKEDGQPEYSKETCLNELKEKGVLTEEFKKALEKQAFLQNMRLQYSN